jgi:Holliday junction resolvase
MRRAARVDDNQAEIVAALRKCGCTVQSLAALGNGVPDLLVGRAGVNYLLEVKDGSKPKSARELTPDELRWLHAWRGSAAVVETVEEALKEVGVLE